MKALRLERPGELELVEIEPPVPAPDQLLIRTSAATICTSDLQDIRSNAFGIVLPMVMGHEACGVVIGIGADVDGFAIGDRVAAHPVHPCGECGACRSGLAHLCRNLSHFGIDMQGVFAEQFVVRQDRARLLPDDVSDLTGPLAEPVCVCLEALNRAKLAPGQSLLIVGDGPFGVMMARLARRLDLAMIAIAGRHERRLAAATGALPIKIDRDADPAAAIARANPAGFDAVIHTAGGARMINVGLRALRPRGRLVVFSPMEGETPVDLFTVLVNELEILGAVNDEDLFDASIAALADPDLALGELVTHEFGVDDFRRAFALAERGHDVAMKVALRF